MTFFIFDDLPFFPHPNGSHKSKNSISYSLYNGLAALIKRWQRRAYGVPEIRNKITKIENVLREKPKAERPRRGLHGRSVIDDVECTADTYFPYSVPSSLQHPLLHFPDHTTISDPNWCSRALAHFVDANLIELRRIKIHLIISYSK